MHRKGNNDSACGFMISGKSPCSSDQPLSINGGKGSEQGWYIGSHSYHRDSANTEEQLQSR